VGLAGLASLLVKSPAILRVLALVAAILLSGASGHAAGPVLFEAENGVLSRGADRLNDPTASGGGCVHLPEMGGNIAWVVEVPHAGRYALTLRYRAHTADRAQIIHINGTNLGWGFSRTDEGWLETSRSFTLGAGRNRIEVAGDWGDMDVDYLRLSGSPSEGPASVYELPALTPRHTVFYAATPRPLGFKVDLNGHALSKTLVDGRSFAAVRRPFSSWPDSLYLEVPASALRDLGLGTHVMEFIMEDGSRATAEVSVKGPATKAPFTIVTFDIGHGKASLLSLPGGEIVLVDTAEEAPARGLLVPFLQRHGIKRIDHLFITHYHSDHAGGLELIKANFQIGRLYDYKSFKTGDTFSIGDVHVLVMNAYDAGDDENSRSLALRWTYGDFSYADGADNYAINQAACLQRFPDAIRSTVYSGNHHFHGSVDVNFLRKVDASLYLVSAEEAVYARGAYLQRFKSEVEPHLRSQGSRFRETLLTWEVGTIVIRVQADGQWDYETYQTTAGLQVPALP
jgi:beta-lactamase superfamily II metal-dependent hydrolase